MLTESEYFTFIAFHAHQFNFRNSFCEPQSRFQTVGEAARNVVFLYQSVNDYFNRVLLVTSQTLLLFQKLRDIYEFSVDPGTHVPLASKLTQQSVVFPLTAANNRRENLETCSVWHLQNAINDLLRRLPLQCSAIFRAVLHTNARVEQAQIVVNLSNGSHR